MADSIPYNAYAVLTPAQGDTLSVGSATVMDYQKLWVVSAAVGDDIGTWAIAKDKEKSPNFTRTEVMTLSVNDLAEETTSFAPVSRTNVELSRADIRTSQKCVQRTLGGVAAKESLPAPELTIDPAKTYTATIETTEGTIVFALDAANAPNSVNNFVYLARSGFYDGLLFNRATEGFWIQTGSPNNTLSGGPGYTIQSEAPPGRYEVGSVAWVPTTGTEREGTAGSQFFIGTESRVTLPLGNLGYIGKVTEGLDVAQRIMGFAPEDGDGPPSPPVQMTRVTITES